MSQERHYRNYIILDKTAEDQQQHAVDPSLINLEHELLEKVNFPLSQFEWGNWSDADDNGKGLFY